MSSLIKVMDTSTTVTTLAAKTMMPNTMARVARVRGRTVLSLSSETKFSTRSVPRAGRSAIAPEPGSRVAGDSGCGSMV